MSELNINKLNELLNQQADKELRERIHWLFDDADNGSNQISTEQAIFTNFCEANRARYVSEWLKKMNKALEMRQGFHGGGL